MILGDITDIDMIMDVEFGGLFVGDVVRVIEGI